MVVTHFFQIWFQKHGHLSAVKQSLGVFTLVCLSLSFYLALCHPVFSQDTSVKNQTLTASDARVGGNAEKTRFVLDMSKPTDFSLRVVDKPYRVVIDMPSMVFEFPAGIGKTGRGLIRGFRYGKLSADKSRIVLDLSAAAIIDKSFMLKPSYGQPARLVIDMKRTNAKDFSKIRDFSRSKMKKSNIDENVINSNLVKNGLRTYSDERIPINTSEEKSPSKSNEDDIGQLVLSTNRPAKIPLPMEKPKLDVAGEQSKSLGKLIQNATKSEDDIAHLLARLTQEKTQKKELSHLLPRPKPKLPKITKSKKKHEQGVANTALHTPKRKPRRKRNTRTVIIIDPGHGGVDPGAIGRRGTTEKSVNIGFSKILHKKLKATGRYDVFMTRTEDKYLTLRERVTFTRRKNADLFISVHSDSVKRGNVRGATVYTLSEKASDKEAAALAAKENRADIIAGVDLKRETNEVTGILIDLAQRETKNHSVLFGQKLVRRLKRKIRVNKRPMRSAGFRVLKAPDVPSVLLELGYLSNRADEANLRSSRWRSRTASAVVEAINDYFVTRVASNR